jgi:hypothetical protein
MVKEKKVKIGNKEYKFQWLKGKVLEVKSLSHTRGGGTINIDPRGYTSNQISFNAVEQLDIFLEDANGDEHAFKVEEFNFSCRQDHEITIIKMMVNNTKHGPFIGLFNHNTKEFKTKYGLLQTMSRPSSSMYWLLALGLPFFIFIFTLLGLDYLFITVFDSASDSGNLPLYYFASFITISALWIALIVLYQKKKSSIYNRLVKTYKSLDI